MKVWAADENDSGYSTPLLKDVFELSYKTQLKTTS